MDYNKFDNLTYANIVNSTDLIPNSEIAIESEHYTFITGKVEALLESHGIVFKQDLQTIINEWDIEESLLFAELAKLKKRLLKSVKKLQSIIIGFNDFDKFLDELIFTDHKDHTDVHSKYLEKRFIWFTEGFRVEAVGKYIEKLVDEGWIILQDFDVWDEFFTLSIGSKFGE